MLVSFAIIAALAVLAGVVALRSRRKKTRPRPFALPTDPLRAAGREAEFRKMAAKFKDPLWDEDDQGEA